MGLEMGSDFLYGDYIKPRKATKPATQHHRMPLRQWGGVDKQNDVACVSEGRIIEVVTDRQEGGGGYAEFIRSRVA